MRLTKFLRFKEKAITKLECSKPSLLSKFISTQAIAAFGFVALAVTLPVASHAQDATAANTDTTAATQQAPAPATTTSSEDIGVELNKLETLKNGCRAYVVVNNKSQTIFKTMKLDLVLFRPDGIIGRRFAVDLAPVRANKRTVKLFDLDGVACDQVGSFLVNDVLECSERGGKEDPNCLARLSVSSLAKAQLSK